MPACRQIAPCPIPCTGTTCTGATHLLILAHLVSTHIHACTYAKQATTKRSFLPPPLSISVTSPCYENSNPTCTGSRKTSACTLFSKPCVLHITHTSTLIAACSLLYPAAEMSHTPLLLHGHPTPSQARNYLLCL